MIVYIKIKKIEQTVGQKNEQIINNMYKYTKFNRT